MSFNYRFHIPNYVSNSNGIAVLWESAYQFSKVRNVTISTFYHGESREYELPDKYKKLLSNKKIATNSTIVIYPDAMHGNPLEATMVSRYMLAKEFIFDGKKIEYADGDYLFCYSRAVSEVLDRYNISLDNLLEIKENSRPKIKGKLSVYYGKCRIAMHIHNFSRLLSKFTELSIITRTNPSEKKDLYKEIAESELFVSFDGLSSLCHEATLLGTPVIIMDDAFRSSYENFDHKLYGFYYCDDIDRLDFLIKDSANLSEIANLELDTHTKTMSKRTDEILDKIESHFNSTNRISEGRVRNEAYHKEALNFYVEKWKCSPILNCFSLKSVIGFHILNARPSVYFILRSLHLLTCKAKLKFKKIIFSIKNIYDENELKNIKYQLNQTKIINQYLTFFSTKLSPPTLPVIKSSILKFKMLAKMLCI